MDLVKFATVRQIERGCVEYCPYGCRYTGYGLMYRRCTSCCSTYGCNSDSGADRHAGRARVSGPVWLALAALALYSYA